MAYVVVICPKCGGVRASVSDVSRLKCPWCGATFPLNKARIVGRYAGMREAAEGVRRYNTPSSGLKARGVYRAEETRPTLEGVGEERRGAGSVSIGAGGKEGKLEKGENKRGYDIEAIAASARNVVGGRTERLRFIARELTRARGSFSIDDAASVLLAMDVEWPREDLESAFAALLESGDIYEPHPGRYRAV